jgi:predicted ATPase
MDAALGRSPFTGHSAIFDQANARNEIVRPGAFLRSIADPRPIEAHYILAPALQGFAATSELPAIEEAQTLLAALAETEEVKAAEAHRQRRLHLQTAYGKAMMWAKGFSAQETRTAFSRATELTAKTDSFEERFAAAHGQWTVALLRGELSAARKLAFAMLQEAEDAGHKIEASVARCGLGVISYFRGEFLEARSQSERTLAGCDPKSDREVRERFGDDIVAIAMSFLAVTDWQLGEVERARELIEASKRRAIELEHSTSLATPLYLNSVLELLRGDAAAARQAAVAMEALARDQGMILFRTEGELLSAAASGQMGNSATEAVKVRQALVAYAEQGAILSTRFFKALLAQLEAEGSGAQNALNCIDEALAQADQAEDRWDLAFTYRLRGDILLKVDPENVGPAEQAYLTAIAIAQQQNARSFGLRAALSLAKLYQSTGRPTEAHAVLAPALDGFSPTPEMPEIAEAQALLAALDGRDATTQPG